MSKTDVLKLLKLYTTSFEQMRVVRWRRPWHVLHLRPIWLIRLQKENNLEHIAGMLSLADLVFYLAEMRGDETITNLDQFVVRHKIWVHDSEEWITGDYRAKGSEYYRTERAARWVVIRFLKEQGRADLAVMLGEYHKKLTPEERFVKVLDELQAWAFMLFIGTPKWTTRDFTRPESIPGYVFASEFPLLQEIADELLARMHARLNI